MMILWWCTDVICPCYSCLLARPYILHLQTQVVYVPTRTPTTMLPVLGVQFAVTRLRTRCPCPARNISCLLSCLHTFRPCFLGTRPCKGSTMFQIRACTKSAGTSLKRSHNFAIKTVLNWYKKGVILPKIAWNAHPKIKRFGREKRNNCKGKGFLVPSRPVSSQFSATHQRNFFT